jgi:polysaccharide export outer membrane protein
MIRVVFSLIVAILVSSSALMLRAQTNTAVSPANSVSAPEAVRTASGQSAVASDEFVIGPGDVLAINVWKETEISKVVPVRSDGRISLPLIGELQSGGLTPRQLEAEITKRLKDYVADPSVTVVVQEIHSKSINVLGMVARPGLYPLTKTMTVVDALANAGGFRDFAKQKSIYILRQNPDGTQARLPFNYKEVIKGVNPAQNVKLQPGDNIVVP